jgi:hypothetical protein
MWCKLQGCGVCVEDIGEELPIKHFSNDNHSYDFSTSHNIILNSIYPS